MLTAVDAGMTNKGDWAKDIKHVAYAASENKTALYTQDFTNDHLRLLANALFVTTANESGIYVNDDVKVILHQYNKNVKDTLYFDGIRELKSIVDAMNSNGGDKYDYDISAMLVGGRATVVIIDDVNNTYSRPAAPNKNNFKGVGLVVSNALDASKKLTIDARGIVFDYYKADGVAIKGSEIKGLLENAGCTDVSVVNDAGTWKVGFTYDGGVYKNVTVTPTQYFKVTLKMGRGAEGSYNFASSQATELYMKGNETYSVDMANGDWDANGTHANDKYDISGTPWDGRDDGQDLKAKIKAPSGLNADTTVYFGW